MLQNVKKNYFLADTKVLVINRLGTFGISKTSTSSNDHHRKSVSTEKSVKPKTVFLLS